MNFGRRTPEAESRKIIDRALELGIRHFDTANAYNDGESERVLGRALEGRRCDVVIATKVGFGKVGGKMEGLSKNRVIWAIDESLERLGTDYVDLYYLHVPDRSTPIEETLEGVAEVLSKGRTKHWAVSNYSSWQVLEMIGLSKMLGIPPPIGNQLVYNLLVRQIEIEYLEFAKRYNLHTTVYNPLAGGLLSGRYTDVDKAPKGSRFDRNAMYRRRYFSEAMHTRAVAMGELAAKNDLSLIELAYGWLAARSKVDSILVGPAELDHLEVAAKAIDRVLPEALVKKVDELYIEHQGTDVRYAR